MTVDLRLRVGRYALETNNDQYGRLFGFLIMQWNRDVAHSVWHWNFRKPRWHDDELTDTKPVRKVADDLA